MDCRTGWQARRLFVRTLLASGAAGAATQLTGCFGLAVTTAAIGTMAAVDRRTVGAQTEDQTIELRALRALDAVNGERAAVALTSYNRRVLLTGRASAESDRRAAERRVRELIPNVQALYNEVRVAPPESSLLQGPKDVRLTAQVKTALMRDTGVPAQSVKVLTEQSRVYLMGLVTPEEGEIAALIASRQAGVERVVTVFEYLSADDVRRLTGGTPAF